MPLSGMPYLKGDICDSKGLTLTDRPEASDPGKNIKIARQKGHFRFNFGIIWDVT